MENGYLHEHDDIVLKYDHGPRSFEHCVREPVLQAENTLVSEVALVSNRWGDKFPVYASHIPAVAVASHPYVLVSGGVHGDEPAGVLGAVAFLSQVAPRFSDRINFLVLPCVNPTGFQANTLASASGANLNRCFGIGSQEPEVLAIERWLAEFGHRFKMTFDLHEVGPDYTGEGVATDDNPRGCYLYETQAQHDLRIGPQMIAALPRTIEVCRWDTIYGDINRDGVVSYPEGCRNEIYAAETSFDAFLQRHYTGHSFTTETSTLRPLAERANVQLLWLECALNQMLNLPS